MFAATCFALAMIVSAAVGYRSMAWSLDTPVLRRALRCGRFARSTPFSLLLGVASAAWAVHKLGEQQINTASLLAAGMFFLFGGAAGLFCSLVAEDVTEVFLRCATRLHATLRLRIAGLDEARCDVQAPRRCGTERHCTGVEHPCQGSPSVSHPWRSADWQRSRQHR